jgi:hypothetical protein
MSVASLEEIVRELESYQEQIRVKKLLFLACTGKWEGDNGRAAKLDTYLMVERLRVLEPDFPRLRRRLRRAAAYLNKPHAYGVLAEEVAQTLARLYSVTQLSDHDTTRGFTRSSTDVTVPNDAPSMTLTGDEKTTLSSFPIPNRPTTEGAIADPDPPSSTPPSLPTYDWFALRAEIVQAANPLRVKILCFFTLSPQNNFNAYTWASIKSDMLDRQLYRLYEQNPTFEILEERLYATVQRFPETEEYVQAADALIRGMKVLVYEAAENQAATASKPQPGRYPGFELFEPVADQATQLSGSTTDKATADSDEAADEDHERSLLAVENAFMRP